MSQYIDFFLRHGDDFISLGDFSRNTKLYNVMRGQTPYEKIRPFTERQLNDYWEELSHEIEKNEKAIRKLKDRIELIKEFNNSVEEKAELIHDIEEEIEEYEFDIKECEYNQNFLSFLEDIINIARYNERETIDVDNYIYAGIEIGYPTLSDIEDEE